MSDWLHNLPLVWMAIFVFGCTFLVTAAICWIVTLLAVGERVPSFKAVSPGILPPLGIIFGLLPRRRSGATINKQVQRWTARRARCEPLSFSHRVFQRMVKHGCARLFVSTSERPPPRTGR